MRKHTLYKGHSLSYEITGTGPVVVLLHGFGETTAVWRNQKQHLQHRFRVVLPDIPGTSGSEMIADMSLEGIAESLHFILQLENISDFILIGHSMGGYIALAYAEKYSQDLQGIGLFHSSAYADGEEKKATRKKGIAFMQEHGGYEFLKTSVPNLYSTTTKRDRAALIGEHLSTVHNMTATAMTAYYQAMIERPDRTGVLKAIALPVLFVLGAEDTAVPMEQGLQQASLPDLCYIHILDQSGHMGMLEEAEKSNDLLTEYLSFTLETATA